MSNRPDLTIWETRWQALNAIIDDYKALLQQEPRLSAPRTQTLSCLLERLQAFADDQFHFFYDGLDAQNNFILNPSAGFPREYVFRVTLNQVASDLEVIRRTMDQRISGSPAMMDMLEEADKLAWQALQPVVGADKLVRDQATTVITYFKKSASIRLIPYAPVLLIGIPFTARSVPRDYLLLAHEVGHYVYRRGEVDVQGGPEPIPKTLGDRISGSPAWVQYWREEIFADVFSCLVGGPVMGLSSQDLALESSLRESSEFPGDFTWDDGDHPAPVVRPFLYTDVLERIGLQISADKLNDRWQYFVGRQLSAAFKPQHEGPEVRVGLSEARKVLGEIIEQVLSILQPHAPSTRWSNGLTAQAEVDTLYTDFEGNYQGLVSGIVVPELPAPCPPPGLWNEWAAKEKFFPSSPKLQPPPPPAEIEPGRAGKLDELEQEPRDTWNHAFLANGWTTEVGNHNGGT